MTETVLYDSFVSAAAPPANRGGQVMLKIRRRQCSKQCWSLTALITTFVAIGLAAAGALADEAPRDRARSDVAAGSTVERRLEAKYGLTAVDAVRLDLFSFFGTVQKFADELGVQRGEVEEFLDEHRWQLPVAPALALQNKDLSGREFLRVSSGQVADVGPFVTQDGTPGSPATTASIRCDREAIVVSITCRELDIGRLTAKCRDDDGRPPVGPVARSGDRPQRGSGDRPQRGVAKVSSDGGLSPRQRMLWDGDFVGLKRAFGNNVRELVAWAKRQRRPKRSVLLDDCVTVMITPVAIGKDRSHLFPASFVPDPAKWLSETRPPRTSRIYLEGAYYWIAVNPNGAVLDVFMDPWDGGTVCPAWPSKAKVTTKRGDDFWHLELRIPWTSLKPNVNEDSIWAVDLARLRRCSERPGHVTRSPRSTLLRYDVPLPVSARRLPPVPEIQINPLRTSEPVADFPTADQWAHAALIADFFDNRTGEKDDAIEARITYDCRTLFVRFDCREQDLGRLRVVTHEQEEAEYGPQSRRCNYLDRREHFGLDWGDYVEVILAPNLDFADRFHGGLFTFLVNSRGELLERYYDRYGMFNVSPCPPWRSGAKTRVTKSGQTWTVELAIPFGVLCTMGKASSTWGLNLHRARSGEAFGGRDTHLCWSRTAPPFEAPGWSPSLRTLRDPRRLGIMRIDADWVQLQPHPNRPGLASARSAEAAARRPVQRDRRSDRLSSVFFVDRSHGWAAGGLGTILHTSDAGKTWREQPTGTDFILEKVFFVDRNHGWAVGGWPRDAAVAVYGGMGVILATSDGGRHWAKQLEGEAVWLKDVFFLNRRLGWAVGEYGTVLKTTDGGQHWRQIRQTGTASWLYGVAFLDEQHGFAVGHDETIL
ncbi:MAG: hypothetical protein GXP27_03240, partial [Planctomycetes bacterium]|nr:hypothetical protein [Planctomycetota bacterium]